MFAVGRVATDVTAKSNHGVFNASTETTKVLSFFDREGFTKGHRDVVAKAQFLCFVLRSFRVTRSKDAANTVDVRRNDFRAGSVSEVRGSTLEVLQPAVGRASAFGINKQRPAIVQSSQCVFATSSIDLVTVNGDGVKEQYGHKGF